LSGSKGGRSAGKGEGGKRGTQVPTRETKVYGKRGGGKELASRKRRITKLWQHDGDLKARRAERQSGKRGRLLPSDKLGKNTNKRKEKKKKKKKNKGDKKKKKRKKRRTRHGNSSIFYSGPERGLKEGKSRTCKKKKKGGRGLFEKGASVAELGQKKGSETQGGRGRAFTNKRRLLL